jgi:glycosyltransferase involved in cell wall biosynthesis
MKTGLYSPWPPASTGVADYSAALLPYLRECGEVETNPATCDVALYHLGNNSLHNAIYQRALSEPGIAVLHDAVLNHFFLGFGAQEYYIEEFVHNYGEGHRALAAELWTNRPLSGSDPRYFAYPMLKRIATASRAVIVHNPAAAAIVRKHAPDARITEIPHLFQRPAVPSPEETQRFRESLGVAPGTLLLGAFGHQRETKRLNAVLRAFHRALAAGTDVRLLVSGAFVSEPFERAVAPQLAHPRILRTGYLPEPEFWRYAAAADVCLNLRYPSAAETSGIAISMMGIGKPVVFTAGQELARFPENSCLRVEAGPGEESTLAEYIVWLAANPEAAREIGLRAARHIASEHAPELAARRYWAALEHAGAKAGTGR